MRSEWSTVLGAYILSKMLGNRSYKPIYTFLINKFLVLFYGEQILTGRFLCKYKHLVTLYSDSKSVIQKKIITHLNLKP